MSQKNWDHYIRIDNYASFYLHINSDLLCTTLQISTKFLVLFMRYKRLRNDICTLMLSIWSWTSLVTHIWPTLRHTLYTPTANNDPARYRLRSATGTNYSVPRTRTKFGDRAFSVAGPVVWNSLPAAVRHADSLRSFKCRLGSYFFSLCFNDWQCSALQVRFRAWRALNSLSILFYSICDLWVFQDLLLLTRDGWSQRRSIWRYIIGTSEL